MTLVEIVVTLAIVAMVSMLAVPAVSSLTHAQLNHSARSLAQKVREVYTTATLDGGAWRLVLTCGSDKIVAERSDTVLRLDGGRWVSLGEDWQRLREAAGLSSDSDVQTAAVGGLKALMGEELELEGVAPKEPETAAAAGAGHAAPLPAAEGRSFAAAEVRPLQLPGGVHVMDVWTEGMAQPVAEGPAYLYFFPQGYTQSALIHLQDGSARPMTVRVQPLTGKCEIEAGYREAPR